MAKAAKKAKTATGNKETSLIRRVTMKTPNKNINTFGPGDTVNVHVKVKEGEKERVQIFKGIVIRIQGSGSSKNFTVRKVSAGVGVERTFPFSSPAVDKVEQLSIGKVRRARLYYLRNLEGKSAKIESELAAVQKTVAETTETTEA